MRKLLMYSALECFGPPERAEHFFLEVVTREPYIELYSEVGEEESGDSEFWEDDKL
jgi:hypothetical protein